jgi:gliding motility-associated-like protein
MRNFLITLFSILTINSFSQEIFVPNAFTPNGDGQNDYFEVFCIEKDSIEFFSIEIYNSYGQKVFSAFDINEKWFGGNEYYSNTNTFIYIIRYKPYNSFGLVKKTGIIFIIR